MSRITVTKTIYAHPELVFRTVADIRNFSKAVPNIVDVTFLSEKKSGVGTRFRETRTMNGKKTTTDLVIAEYAENDHIRIVADSNGTIWDSLFTVKKGRDHTELTLVMDAKAYKFLPKIMNIVMKYFIKKELENDMNAVKRFCENNK